MTRLYALVLSILTALGLALFVAPGTAQAAPESPLTYCVKNSPASGYAVQVEFRNDDRIPADYIDYVQIGGVEGECGNSNIFAEPDSWRIPAHWCGRWRTWYPSDFSRVTAFSSWIPASSATYPNGRWIDFPNSSFGGDMFEVQIVNGDTLSTC